MIFEHEGEKEYLKRIAYLINHDVLKEGNAYDLNKAGIDTMCRPQAETDQNVKLLSLDDNRTEAYLRYVFLDVVDYTKCATEEQADIIWILQLSVWVAVREFGDQPEQIAFLPTGDGMCIVLKKDEEDSHLKLALRILEVLPMYAKELKFTIRIGLNENKDIVYRDVNGRENYAGRGINIASRVMGKAGGSQIAVGTAVFERLSGKKQYINKFIPYHNVKIKNEQITIYQYVDPDCSFLDSSPLDIG
jgi:hypothetical protein